MTLYFSCTFPSAEACLSRLAELNPYVSTAASSGPLDATTLEQLRSFQVCTCTQSTEITNVLTLSRCISPVHFLLLSVHRRKMSGFVFMKGSNCYICLFSRLHIYVLPDYIMVSFFVFVFFNFLFFFWLCFAVCCSDRCSIRPCSASR